MIFSLSYRETVIATLELSHNSVITPVAKNVLTVFIKKLTGCYQHKLCLLLTALQYL